MDQRLSMITLGVSDLARSRRFYEEGLGWRVLQEYPEVAFYQLPGMVLGLFGAAALAEDAGAPLDRGSGGFSLAINLTSREAVDALLAEVPAEGRVLRAAEAKPWGIYSGYFADPDGHPWEVAHNPDCTIHPDGSTTFQAG